ncbi:ArdC-like ssDNA-binding domain-containing protein [Cryobacterium sp. PH31-AA6]|uniref:ArdC-like ssDNA-binding domain-containing protein n=1 Tax=Cryobacterium sp. PH31-AA6 TaxID=3046205 RepID=UPI0024B9BD1E|nr:ArdC-like ssDNA-binding domain-containing protein [Cryobacterium sp. PH31-AA6]MDJ0324185.1 ArdC-like ssDNA-binding domain-containing protein [Cryobacterium sp. PH31-AA6]
MSTKPQLRQDRDAKLTELHEQLVSSVEALVTGDEWKKALEFAARFRTRSFNNTLLIWTQHAAAYEHGLVPGALPTYVAGFKQWQTLGRRVVAGQKGYLILAPLTARFATSSPTDAGSWRRLDRNERPRAGEVVRQRMIGVRAAYVWDVSQTDGSLIPERPAPALLTGEAPRGLWAGLAAIVHNAGFALSTAPDAAALGGANGLTDFERRTVSVRADMDAAAQVKTLAHELAHIHLHAPDAGTVSHRGIGEVEAESVALMIGAAHGMDTSDYTIPYVSSWASSVEGKTASEVALETGERVRRAAVVILDQLQTDQIGAGDPPEFDRSQPTQNLTTGATAPAALPIERLVARSL